MYTLVIKGHRFDASAACSARGIDHWLVRESLYGDTIMRADTTVEKLSAWFVEDAGQDAPFSIGSLLWYGPIAS